MTLLTEDGLDVSVFASKCCQLFLRDLDMLSAIVETVPFAQFFGQLLQFTFRTPGEFRVGTITFAPAASNIRIPNTHIERVVTHLDLGSLNGRVAHGFTPVIEVIHPDADARLNFYRPF